MSEPASLSEVLLAQGRAWRGGQRPTVEEILSRHPHLAGHADSVLDLIYQEIVLREEAGERPRLGDYSPRFPQLQEQLRLQFEVDEAITVSQGPGPPISTLPAPVAAEGLEGLPRLEGVDLLDELGRGSMGVVYRGWQRAARRPVAVKVMASEMPAGRARTEVEAATRLQHPHIVTVYEVKEVAGRVALVLEYVEGGNLAEKIDGKPQPPRDAARFVEALAWAMAYAHGRGVVHRDLKPSNILLSGGPGSPLSQCQPRISDFGLAKLIESSAHLTKTSDVLGTPSYMAPEQASSANLAGPAADIYALGAILYECLTGRPPFLGQGLLDTLDLVRRQDPVPPSRIAPGVSRDLEVICLKCLSKQPEQRYASSKELAEDLRRFLGGEPIQARPVGWPERLWKWALRHPAWAALAAVSLLAGVALVAGGYVFAALQSQAREEADRLAGRLRKRLAHTRQLLYTAQLLRVGATLNSDPAGGLRMLQSKDACPDDLRCFSWGVLHGLCKPHRHADSHAHPVVALAMTPDGKYTATATSDGALHVWAGPGEEVKTWSMPGGKVEALAVADGLVAAAKGGRVAVWALPSGEKKAEVNLGRFAVGGLALSRDGRLLAVNGALPGGARGVLSLWAVAEPGKRLAVDGTTSPRCGVALSPDGKTVACAGPDHAVRLWHTDTGKERRKLTGHTAFVRCVAFDHRGELIAAGANDGLAIVWPMSRGGPEKTERWARGPIRALALHPRGAELAAAAEGREDDEAPEDVYFWGLDEKGNEEVVRAHRGATGVAYAPDGKTMVSAGEDRALKWWSSPRPLRSLNLRPPGGGAVAVTPNGQKLAWAIPGGGAGAPDEVAVYRLGQRAPGLTLRGHSHSVRAVALTADERLALTAGGKPGELAEVLVWRLASGRYVQVLGEHKGACSAVAASLDGKYLATAAEDGVRLFELDESKEQWKEAWRRPGRCAALAFSDGLLAGLGERLWTWELSGERVGEVEVPTGAAGLALCARRKTAAVTVPGQGVVWLISLEDGGRAGLDVGMKEVRHVALSPDGQALAVAGSGNGVRVWDVETRQERAALGRQRASFVAFVNGGQALLAVSARAGKAQIWYSDGR